MSNEFVYVRANAGEAYWVMGDLFTYLVTGTESGGSYFTLIANVAPHGGPPPLTEETVARLLAAEAAGWKEHHDTLPPR